VAGVLPAGPHVSLVRQVVRFALLGVGMGARLIAAEPAFEGIPAARLRLVIDHAYNLEADAAAQITGLEHDFPDALVPGFIAVTRGYWLQNYAEVDAGLTAQFQRDAAALLERTRQAAREHPGDRELACLAGLTQLLAGLYGVEQRHWWTAFWRVRAGRNTLLRVLEADPGYADAKLGPGLADCYLDRTPPYLKPLTLLLGASGDLNRGVQRLREAQVGGLITRVEAGFYLAGVEAELRQDLTAARTTMEPIAARYPANPFFQRILAYFELHSGLQAQGRRRLVESAGLPATRLFPALAVRSRMWLCWDCMRTKDYVDALNAAVAAEQVINTAPSLARLRPETLTGEGEALKALGRYEEALARFNAVPAEFADERRRALARAQAIRQELAARR
jgi:tetratricopeptide (TPR) repeat protein